MANKRTSRNNNNRRRQSRRRPRRKPSRRKNKSDIGIERSIVPTLLRAANHLISVIPGVPAAIVKVADFALKSFGVSSSPSFSGKVDVAITGLCGFFLLPASELFINTTAAIYDANKRSVYTNYSSVQLYELTVTVSPSNPRKSIQGFVNLGFSFIEDEKDIEIYKAMTYGPDYVSIKRMQHWIRAPNRLVTLTGRATSSYQQRAHPLDAYLAVVAFNFTDDDREEYKAFTAGQAAFDFSIAARIRPARAITDSMQKVNIQGCYDIMSGGKPTPGNLNDVIVRTPYGCRVLKRYEFDPITRCLTGNLEPPDLDLQSMVLDDTS